MNIKHSSKSPVWYSPASVVEDSRHVLGSIDLDPASDSYANQTIKATHIYTEQDDGLKQPWDLFDGKGSIFLNAPGGILNRKSLAGLFWAKLMEERKIGFNHAIFIGFSIEIMQVSQNYHELSVLDFPVCVPSSRIKFEKQNEKKASPSHANVIVYVPGRINHSVLFAQTFAKYGKIKL